MANNTNSPNRDQGPPQFDSRIIERDILLHSLRSRRFFLQIANRVAPPLDQTGRIHRKDFADPAFQLAYEAIATAWQKYDSLANDQDYQLPLAELDSQLAFAVTDSRLSEQDAKNLVEQIRFELDHAEWRPDLMEAFLNGTAFKEWLAGRIVCHAVKKLNAQNLQGTADLDALRKALQEAEASIGSHEFDQITVEPLMSIDHPSEGDEIIGPKRFGIRGALITFIGRTGIGKSSFALQLGISFAIGQAVFGFVPNGKLRVLIIQAENDAGDIAAMRDGILGGLRLTVEQKQDVTSRVFVAQVTGLRGDALVNKLKPILRLYQPDILVLDPALAFLEGDVKEQKDVEQVFAPADLAAGPGVQLLGLHPPSHEQTALGQGRLHLAGGRLCLFWQRFCRVGKRPTRRDHITEHPDYGSV